MEGIKFKQCSGKMYTTLNKGYVSQIASNKLQIYQINFEVY